MSAAPVLTLVQPARRRGRPPGVRNRPRSTVADARLVLVPFNAVETVEAPEAARWAGVSVPTLHRWCQEHALGRRIGGRWQVSRLALPMFLEGNIATLADYHAGKRTDAVLDYFDRMLFPRALRQK